MYPTDVWIVSTCLMIYPMSHGIIPCSSTLWQVPRWCSERAGAKQGSSPLCRALPCVCRRLGTSAKSFKCGCLDVWCAVCSRQHVINCSYKPCWYSCRVVIPPASKKLKGGILVSPCPSVDRIVSALYLQQYSLDPFHICTSYQFWRIF